MAERVDPPVGGLGYEQWYRKRIFSDGVDSNWNANMTHSARTHRRWRKRLRERGHLARDPHTGGFSPFIDADVAMALVGYLCAWPTSNNTDVAMALVGYHCALRAHRCAPRSLLVRRCLHRKPFFRHQELPTPPLLVHQPDQSSILHRRCDRKHHSAALSWLVPPHWTHLNLFPRQ